MSDGLMRMHIGSVLHLLNLQTPVVALIRAARESVKDCIDKVHFLFCVCPAPPVVGRYQSRPPGVKREGDRQHLRDTIFGIFLV